MEYVPVGHRPQRARLREWPSTQQVPLTSRCEGRVWRGHERDLRVQRSHRDAAGDLSGRILALRDRAWMALMLMRYGFVRIGAAIAMRVRAFEDEGAGAGTPTSLDEKGGKERRIACITRRPSIGAPTSRRPASSRARRWRCSRSAARVSGEAMLAQENAGRSGARPGDGRTHRRASTAARSSRPRWCSYCFVRTELPVTLQVTPVPAICSWNEKLTVIDDPVKVQVRGENESVSVPPFGSGTAQVAGRVAVATSPETVAKNVQLTPRQVIEEDRSHKRAVKGLGPGKRTAVVARARGRPGSHPRSKKARILAARATTGREASDAENGVGESRRACPQ